MVVEAYRQHDPTFEQSDHDEALFYTLKDLMAKFGFRFAVSEKAIAANRGILDLCQRYTNMVKAQHKKMSSTAAISGSDARRREVHGQLCEKLLGTDYHGTALVDRQRVSNFAQEVVEWMTVDLTS